MEINPMRLMAFAKEISEAFISGNIPLNDSLTKISEEHELTVPQIQRVAEMANHEANLQLLKRSEDKTFTFSLADVQEVVKRVHPPTMTKTAAMDVISAVMAPVRDLEKTAEKPALEQDPVYPGVIDDCRIRNVNLLLNKIASRVKVYKGLVKSAHLANLEEIENTLHDISAIAKDHIILNDGKLSDLLKFACGHDPENADMYVTIFQAMKDDLMKLGAPVDKSLISDKLEMPDSTLEIINGGHILAVHLDTLKNKISAEDRNAQRTKLLDTFGAAIVDKIYSLKTQDDYNDYMADTLDNLEKKAGQGLDEFVDFLQKEGGPFLSKYGPGMVGAGLGVGAGVLTGVAARKIGKDTGKELTKRHDEREQLEELATRRRIY